MNDLTLTWSFHEFKHLEHFLKENDNLMHLDLKFYNAGEGNNFWIMHTGINIFISFSIDK